MAARTKAPFLIRFFAFWGKLALFFGALNLLGGPHMLPMHRMPADLHWLADGGSLITIGLFLLVPTLFYRIATGVMKLLRPEALVEQLRSLQHSRRDAGSAGGGWHEPAAPRAAPAQKRSRPVQRPAAQAVEDTAVRGRNTRTPLIRR